MGLNNSKAQSEAERPKFDWGLPPKAPPEDELDVDELVLHSWVHCKAKPTPKGTLKSDVDEKRRRQTVLWRKRASFIELDCGEDAFFVSNT